MDEGLITRLTPITDSGLVTFVSNARRSDTLASGMPYDLAVNHVHLLDLAQSSDVQTYLSGQELFVDEWPSYLDASWLNELVTRSPLVTSELVEDGRKYAHKRFSEIPNRPLDWTLSEEFESFELPSSRSRFQEGYLSSIRPLSSEVFGEYFRDARELGSTLYRLETNPRLAYDDLLDVAIEQHIDSLEKSSRGLDPASLDVFYNHPFALRFIQANNDEYFTVRLVDEFAYFDGLYRDGELSLRRLVTKVVDTYLLSLADSSAVSTAAEMVFQKKFSDLDDCLHRLWVAEVFGDVDDSSQLRSEVSARLWERF